MHALHDFQIIENSSFLIIIESCAAYIGYVINNIYIGLSFCTNYIYNFVSMQFTYSIIRVIKTYNIKVWGLYEKQLFRKLEKTR